MVQDFTAYISARLGRLFVQLVGLEVSLGDGYNRTQAQKRTQRLATLLPLLSYCITYFVGQTLEAKSSTLPIRFTLYFYQARGYNILFRLLAARFMQHLSHVENLSYSKPLPTMLTSPPHPLLQHYRPHIPPSRAFLSQTIPLSQ